MEEILVCILLAFLMVIPTISSVIETMVDVIENPDDYDITK